MRAWSGIVSNYRRVLDSGESEVNSDSTILFVIDQASGATWNVDTPGVSK